MINLQDPLPFLLLGGRVVLVPDDLVVFLIVILALHPLLPRLLLCRSLPLLLLLLLGEAPVVLVRAIVLVIIVLLDVLELGLDLDSDLPVAVVGEGAAVEGHLGTKVTEQK